MLKPEQNELLTRTGPGTLTGDLFRRYWLPILLSEELPDPDCPPVRVHLLSEKLVAFRDTKGRLGLISEFCAHRGVSLYFGRNEECGLRCAYHGWKFDVEGQCVDVPSEVEDEGFRQRIRLKSYPCIEQGGVIWTYMGPPEFKPDPPGLEWSLVPETHRFVSKRFQDCNYLQAMEGGIDSSHVSFLHSGALNTDPLFRGSKGNTYNLQDRNPRFEVVESEGGLLIGARRNADNGNYYWRITQWLMPCYTIIPPRGEHPIGAHAWVPIDDEHCFAWSINYHPTRALSVRERKTMESGGGIHVKCIPGTFFPVANKSNDYLIDRTAQHAGLTYSGVEGIAMQDASLQESTGPIQDRTQENLASSDNGIIMARQRLMKAAKNLVKGIAPPALDPAAQSVRSASVVLPADQPFHLAAKEALQAQPDTAPASV
jgi:phenylpropionate dioxygenase-like ring-hydroxylating dioxygenase large terminal subunit